MSSLIDLLNQNAPSLFDAQSIRAELSLAIQHVKDALSPSGVLQTMYALIEPYLTALLPLLGPAALAAALAKLAAYGPKPFRLAFTVAFVNMLVCLGENILQARHLMTDDIDFRLSQASSALDIAFAILFAMRVEMPSIKASMAASAAAITASLSVALSQISQFTASFYSKPIDEALSAFTSTAATCALIAWASQYGTRRTILVAASSVLVVNGNLNWWAQDQTMLLWMRLSELVLALTLAVGTPDPIKPEGKGSNPSKPAVAT